MPRQRHRDYWRLWSHLAARVRSNPSQVFVSVAIAVLLALATWLAGEAGGHWQDAARAETRWSAASLETIRHLYQDEAPLAFDITRLLVTAQALEDAAGEDPASPAAVEAATSRKAAGELRLAHAQTDSLVSAKYEMAELGFDLNARLADLIHRDARLAEYPIPAMVSEGDRLARRAYVAAWLCIPIAALFIAIRVFASRRRTKRREKKQARPDVGLIAQPWMEEQRVLLPSITAFTSWLMLTLLGVGGLSWGMEAARADAAASRTATSISTQILAGQLRSSMVLEAQRTAAEIAVVGLARQFVVVGTPDSGQETLGAAQATSAAAWARVTTRMTALPAPRLGIDSNTVAAMASVPAHWERLLAEQIGQKARAEQKGRAASLAALGTLLAGLAAISASTARAVGPQGLVKVVSIALLGGALLAGLAALSAA